jgi:hypothetical protein
MRKALAAFMFIFLMFAAASVSWGATADATWEATWETLGAGAPVW